MPRDFALSYFWARVAERSSAPGDLPLSPEFEQQVKNRISTDVTQKAEMQVDDFLRAHSFQHPEWALVEITPRHGDLISNIRQAIQ